jgi:hypothetical protein
MHRVDDIGARLALDVDDHGGLVLVPAADLAVLQPVDDVGDVAQQDRRAAAVCDDQPTIGLDAGDLVVGGDGVGLLGAVERPLGAGDVGGHDGGAQVFEGDAVGGEPRQVRLDADRRLEAALHRDVADAGHLAEPLREQRVGEVAHLPQRDRRRRQRQRQHRRIGGIHLGIDRRIGKIARQRRSGGVDGGLHVLAGGVDVAGKVELQCDLAHPIRTRRRHARQRGDLAELALQRRGDERRDRLGVGARKLGRHLDGRKVHLGQRRNGQQPVAEDAAEHHRDAEQRRGDRPDDEG